MKIELRKYKGNLVPANAKAREQIDSFADDVIYVAEISKMDLRTKQQNKLIHQFCKNIEIEAKKQKLSLQDLIKDGTQITMILVKELMFKKLCMSLYGKESTTKLNKDELNLVFDSIILALANKGMDTSNLLRDHD